MRRVHVDVELEVLFATFGCPAPCLFSARSGRSYFAAHLEKAMIEFEMMRQLLCSEYDGLREKVVAAADDWIGAKGEFIPHL